MKEPSITGLLACINIYVKMCLSTQLLIQGTIARKKFSGLNYTPKNGHRKVVKQKNGQGEVSLTDT